VATVIVASLIAAARLASVLATGDVTLARACDFALPAVLLCEDVSVCAAIAVAESRLVPDAVNRRATGRAT
jgi:hypothetical protein